MVGKGIKYFRQRSALSQKKLAKKIGVSQNHISIIENDKIYPTLDFLKKISKALGIPIPVLFWFSIDHKDFKNVMVAKIVIPKINDMIHYILKKQ